MLLHAALLRTQDEEVHDHENQHERQQRHQHVTALPATDLGERRGDQHRVLLPDRLAMPSQRDPEARRPKSARTIAAAGAIATWPGALGPARVSGQTANASGLVVT